MLAARHIGVLSCFLRDSCVGHIREQAKYWRLEIVGTKLLSARLVSVLRGQEKKWAAG